MGPSIELLSQDRYYTVYVVRANVKRGREEVDRRALAGPGTQGASDRKSVKSRVAVNYMLGINHNELI